MSSPSPGSTGARRADAGQRGSRSSRLPSDSIRPSVGANFPLVTRTGSGRDDDPGRPEALEQLVRQIGGYGLRSRDTVHLYLDVSGSVESLLEPLYAAVRVASELIWRDIHLFSTDVVDVPLRDLAKRACQTTGGTSIVAVARHIHQNGVRRAVIVTDGEVGCLGTRDEEILRETILGVALTSDRQKDGDLARLARRVVVLPGLESGRGPGSWRRRGRGGPTR